MAAYQPAVMEALASHQSQQSVPITPTSPGGRSVRITRGSSSSAYQTANRVQRRFVVGGPKAMPLPTQAVSGSERKAWAANACPPGAACRDASPGAKSLPQLGTGYVPVAEHDDSHFRWNRRSQFLQQFHHRVHPGSVLGGLVDALSHGNGATAVHDTDDDGSGQVAFQCGGQGQRAGAPPSQDPSQQGREAERNVQFNLAGAGPVAGVVELLTEILAEGVPFAQGRESRYHGVLAGAASENSSAYPQRQASQLWLREVR